MFPSTNCRRCGKLAAGGISGERHRAEAAEDTVPEDVAAVRSSVNHR